MRTLPDLTNLPTPCFLIDEQALLDNLLILDHVQRESGCRILLAQKAFSMFRVYPLIAKYLKGTAASGVYEARLGRERFGGETHLYSPAFTEENFQAALPLADHMVFNSFAQWERFGPRALAAGVSCGLRVNPEHSTQDHVLYDPCAPCSRLGVTRDQFRPDRLCGLSGLHFHCLCQQGADALAETLAAVEQKFGEFLHCMSWVNFGGGHHITRPGYDIDLLIRLIRDFSRKYDITVYLEPGEAVALNAGYLIAAVADIVHNGMDIAVLNASAACHMPDVLEMPYRPPLLSSGLPGEKSYTYRLTGPTCLNGDIIGDYSFDHPLAPGSRLAFQDMAVYTMVKTNTFNGMPLPAILLWHTGGGVEIVREFGYGDFESRLS